MFINIILDYTASIIDIILLYLYYRTFFPSHRKEVPNYLFVLSFIVAELLLTIYANFMRADYSNFKMISTILLNLIISYLLTYLYEASALARLFVVLSAQTIFALSEMISAGLFPTLLSSFFPSHADIDLSLLLISKLIFFLILCVIKIFWKRRLLGSMPQYSIFLLTAPIAATITVMALPFPFENTRPLYFSLIAYIFLFLLNVVNFILLDNFLYTKELEKEKLRLNQQITFQSEKYNQLSETYRSTRRILHDTKKHYMVINKCAQEQDYETILKFLKTSLDELERSYSLINTGNLVIDAFVSNYMALAQNEGITFTTNIRIKAEQVPVENYDLCIILGYLLDNSLQETRMIVPPHERYISVEIIGKPDKMILHIINSKREFVLEDEKRTERYMMYHGYGIKNVQNITKKLLGSYSIHDEPTVYDVVVVLPNLKYIPPKRKVIIERVPNTD